MTFVRDLIFALSASLIVASLLALVWRAPRPTQAAAVWPFLMLFLATWAGGVWLSPIGPSFFGGYALPFLFVAFVVALVIAASAPPGRRLRHAGPTEPDPDAVETASLAGISLVLWIVLFSLLAAIVSFYVMR